MSKCHVEELNRVYRAIFQDALYAYPALRVEFEKDQIRLSEFVVQRGIHAYCVDLPAAGKHLDQALARGEYTLSGLPLTGRYSGRVVIPKFLRGLYLLVFDKLGCLRRDYDVTALLFLRQILYAGKKADIQCSDDNVAKEIRDFVVVDSSLPEPDSFWSSRTPGQAEILETYTGFSRSPLYRARLEECAPAARAGLSILLAVLDKVSGMVSEALGPYRYGEHRFKHGPGAVSNLPSESNKYIWTNWGPRLEHVFPYADCAFHNYAAWVGYVREERVRELLCPKYRYVGSREPASRLIDVPKTLTRPRLIATEPSEHQWCQQNIWHFLDSRVRATWLSDFLRFRDQGRNQYLCKRASQSGRLATVDLSSASDRVTCHLVGQLFRGNLGLLAALQASRTRFIQIDKPHDVAGRMELKKFSTMGSACTFPVESLAFMCIAISAVLAKRHLQPTRVNLRRISREVTIFGDDIIVPEDSRELLFEALELLHFKVNVNKSFWTGLFRESCGVDSYEGHDVTPAYWRASYDGKPESFASTVAVSNNFYSKFMVHTANYLASTIEPDYQVPLITLDSGCCGLKSFVVPMLEGSVMTRFNVGLQRIEAKVPVLIARSSKLKIMDDTSLLQFFTEDPSPFSFWESGVAKRPELKVKLRWVPLEELLLTGADTQRQQDFVGDRKSVV